MYGKLLCCGGVFEQYGIPVTYFIKKNELWLKVGGIANTIDDELLISRFSTACLGCSDFSRRMASPQTRKAGFEWSSESIGFHTHLVSLVSIHAPVRGRDCFF